MLQGLFDRALATAAICVVVIGFAGFMIDDLAGRQGAVDLALLLRMALQSFVRAIGLFWMGASSHPDQDNWLLLLARLCGAIVAAAAVFGLITRVFGRDFDAFRASLYRDHVAVLGFDLRNALLANAARMLDPGRKQIVVGRDNAHAVPQLQEPGRLFFNADIALPAALRLANIRHAGEIVIGGGPDLDNLATAQRVADLRRQRGAEPAARILVRLDDAALADRCQYQPEIARLPNGDEFRFLNDASLSARQLLERTPFAEQAQASGQTRIRLLFTGFSQTVLEIVIQLLRISAFEGMEPIRIDILCEDTQMVAQRIVGRIPNLRHMLGDRDTDGQQPLAWAGRIHLHRQSPVELSYRSGLSETLAKDGAFTAIVVAGDDPAGDLKTALSIRPWTAQNPVFAAPIHVRAGAPSSLSAFYVRHDGLRPKPVSGLLARIGGSADPAAVIEPFGMLEDLYSPAFLFGEREELAERLHEAYRQRRREALARQGDTSRTDLPDWKDLPETYRQANRRAVDFIASARLATGVPDWWDRDAGLPSALVEDPQSLERLSRMAHKSWRADRELDGWRPAAERDSAKRLHTDLVEYDELTEEKKELDREQIRLLASLKGS